MDYYSCFFCHSVITYFLMGFTLLFSVLAIRAEIWHRPKKENKTFGKDFSMWRTPGGLVRGKVSPVLYYENIEDLELEKLLELLEKIQNNEK